MQFDSATLLASPVPLSAMAAVGTLAACSLLEQGHEPFLPPALVPMLTNLVGASLSFASPEGLVPPLRARRPTPTSNAQEAEKVEGPKRDSMPSSPVSKRTAHRSPAVATTSDVRLEVFITLVLHGSNVANRFAEVDRRGVQQSTRYGTSGRRQQETAAATKDFTPGEDEQDTGLARWSGIVIEALLTWMPCRVTHLSLPRAHRARAAALDGSSWDGALTVVVGHQLIRGMLHKLDRHPGLRQLQLSECTFGCAQDMIGLLTPAARSGSGGSGTAGLAASQAEPGSMTVASKTLHRLIDAESIESVTLQRPSIAGPYVPFSRHFAEVMLNWRGFDFPRLTAVDLSFNDDLTDDDVRSLVAQPFARSTLRTLRLWLTPITPAAVTEIAQHCHGLTVLDLGNCTAVDDGAMKELATSPCCRHLVELSVSYTKVTDIGLQDLAEALHAIERLNVRGCKVCDDGIVAVAKRCKQLCSLDATNLSPIPRARAAKLGKDPSVLRGITDVALDALATSCRRLHAVQLTNSKALSAQGIHSFILSRAHNNTPLRTLHLRGTAADDIALMPLSKLLPGLASIELWDCAGVTDKTLDHLFGPASTIAATIESVDVSYTSVTVDGAIRCLAHIFHSQARGLLKLASDSVNGSSATALRSDPLITVAESADEQLTERVRQRRLSDACARIRLKRFLSLKCRSVSTAADAADSPLDADEASARACRLVPLLMWVRTEIALFM